jgi:hypothetical protein
MSGDGPLTSSWCTNWGAFNTPRLWAMVSDEDDPDAWRQVAAWGEVAVAVKDHRARLVQARDALTAAWPPEQNAAAQAFVNELDTLIGRMDIARQDADTTATGLANILEALRTAKNQIQPLYDEYKSKSDDLVPNWWDHAEDGIDEKAQAVMIAAEQIVEQNVPQLKVPDPYTMDPKGARGGFEPMGDGNSTGSSGTGTSGRSRDTTVVPVPHDPVPPMPGHDATVPSSSGGSGPDGSGPDGAGGGGVGGGGSSGGSGGGGMVGGPALAGATPPPPPGAPPVAPSGAPPPGVLPSSGPTSGISPVTGAPMPGLLPGGLPGGVGPGGVGPGGAGPGGKTGGSGLTGPTGVGGGYARGNRPAGRGASRALPSGAVIGETVGGGRGAGAPGLGGVSGRGVTEKGGRAGARGAAKPKPPSWLPEDEPRGSAGGRGGATTGPAGMAASRRAGRRDGDHGDQFDPDNPWEVAEGVDPVITPSDDNPRHDPGPNVIGWHG